MRISGWSSVLCSSDPSLARGGDLFQETFDRALGRKRPEARRHLIGIAGLERARLAREELKEGRAPLIADDDDPLRRNAALPRVEQAAEERRVDRRLERRVGQHDEGIAASQFHDRFLEIAASAFVDRRARATASGEDRKSGVWAKSVSAR